MEQKIILISIVCVFGLFLTLRMRWRRQAKEKKHDLKFHKEAKAVPESLYVESTFNSSAAIDADPVYFNFNGHSWEAYETLGLTPGASPDEVEAAYKKELSLVDSSSQVFITMAYDSIISSLKN